MRFLLLVSILNLVACSTGNITGGKAGKVDVPNDAFKKGKPLSPNEVNDFYSKNSQVLSPALQDETLDRFSKDEIRRISDHGDALLKLSLLCMKHDFNDAYEFADEIFNKYQKIPSYWTQIANCHLNQKSYRKALLFYNKALEISPNYVPALNNIGVMYSRQKQDQKAMVAFERANRQAKFAKTPRYNLAKLSLRYGLYEKALPLFQGLLNESPDDVDLLNAVGTSYFLMSDYQKAMSYYKQIPMKEWSHAEIGINASLTLKKIGRLEDAKKTFSSIDVPDNKDLKTYYAAIKSQLGE